MHLRAILPCLCKPDLTTLLPSQEASASFEDGLASRPVLPPFVCMCTCNGDLQEDRDLRNCQSITSTRWVKRLWLNRKDERLLFPINRRLKKPPPPSRDLACDTKETRLYSCPRRYFERVNIIYRISPSPFLFLCRLLDSVVPVCLFLEPVVDVRYRIEPQRADWVLDAKRSDGQETAGSGRGKKGECGEPGSAKRYYLGVESCSSVAGLRS